MQPQPVLNISQYNPATWCGKDTVLVAITAPSDSHTCHWNESLAVKFTTDDPDYQYVDLRFGAATSSNSFIGQTFSLGDSISFPFYIKNQNTSHSTVTVSYTATLVYPNGSPVMAGTDSIVFAGSVVVPPLPWIEMASSDTVYCSGASVSVTLHGACLGGHVRLQFDAEDADKFQYVNLTYGGQPPAPASFYSDSFPLPAADTFATFTFAVKDTNTTWENQTIKYKVSLAEANKSTYTYTVLPVEDSIVVAPLTKVEITTKEDSIRCTPGYFMVKAATCEKDSVYGIKLEILNWEDTLVKDGGYIKVEYNYQGAWMDITSTISPSGVIWGAANPITAAKSDSIEFRITNTNASTKDTVLKYQIFLESFGSNHRPISPVSGSVKLKALPYLTIIAPDSLGCRDTLLQVDITGVCEDTYSWLQLEVENYSQVKDLFNLLLEDTSNNRDTLAIDPITGAAWGPEPIPAGFDPIIDLYAHSLNTGDSAKTIYFTVSLYDSLKQSTFATARDSIVLLPKPYITVADSSQNEITLDTLGCDPVEFFVRTKTDATCYEGDAIRILFTMPNTGDNQFKDVKLEWYNPSTVTPGPGYQLSVFDSTDNGVGLMYSGTFLPAQIDSFYFKLSNANRDSIETLKIPYSIKIIRNSDFEEIGRTYSGTLTVLPYEGVKVAGLDSSMVCERKDFTVEAWQFCDRSNMKAVKLQLVAANIPDTSLFALEYLWDTPSGDTAYHTIKDYNAGAIIGLTHTFDTISPVINFRVSNKDTSSTAKTVKFVVSIVNATTTTTTYYTTDTMSFRLSPLPKLTLTSAPDSVGCATPGNIAITVGASECANAKALKFVIDNFASGDSVAGLYGLTSVEGLTETVDSASGAHWFSGANAALTTTTGGSVAFKIANLNSRDSLVPVIYSVYLLNNNDSVELAVVKDTVYLKPQPHFKWDGIKPDTVSCEKDFQLVAITTGACYEELPYKFFTISLDTTLVEWYITSNTGGGTYNPGLHPQNTIAMVTKSDTVTISMVGRSDTAFIPQVVNYNIQFWNVISFYPDYIVEKIGETYTDSILVMPQPGVKIEGLETGTIVCDQQPFTIQAWDYCDDTVANKVPMLQLANPNDTAYFRLEYEYPVGTGQYDTVKNYNGGGYIYGLPNTFYDLSDTIRFRLVNNNTTDSIIDVKYNVAIVNRNTWDTLYTTDTITFTLAALPKIEVTAPDTVACATDTIRVTTANTCAGSSLFRLEIENFVADTMKDWFTLTYERYGTVNLVDSLVKYDGTIIGPDVIPQGVTMDVQFAITSKLDLIHLPGMGPEEIYYTLSLLNADSSVIVSHRDSIVLLPKAHVSLIDTAGSQRSFKDTLLSCDPIVMWLEALVYETCAQGNDNFVRITFPSQDTLKYIGLEYRIDTSSSYPPAQYDAWGDAKPFFNGGIMYSDPYDTINTIDWKDKVQFRLTNTNTFSSDTVKIPYTLELVQSDLTTVAAKWEGVLSVLPYKGIDIDIVDSVSCLRQDISITAWDFCDAGKSKAVAVRLLDTNDIDLFYLEYELLSGVKDTANKHFTAGVLYGMQDVFTDSISNPIEFTIINNNTSGSDSIVSFVLSIVNSTTVADTLYLLKDTIDVTLKALPKINVTPALDTVSCQGDSIVVSTINGTCSNISLLKLEIENFVDVDGLFTLRYENYNAEVNIDSILHVNGNGGYMFGPDTIPAGVQIPGVTFRVTSTNDSINPVTLYYRLSLVNADTTEITSYRDTVVLLPQPYIKLLDSSQLVTTGLTADCDTTHFSISFDTKGKCYKDSALTLRITLDSADLLKYVYLDYLFEHAGGTTAYYDMAPYFNNGVMVGGYPFTNKTDTVNYRVISANIYDTIEHVIYYTVDFVLASDNTVSVGKSYRDSIVVLPHIGAQTDLSAYLTSDTLCCERINFVVEAWDKTTCARYDTPKVVKLELPNPSQAGLFTLSYWYNGNPADPNFPAGYYDVQASYYVGGALYGMSDVFGQGESVNIPFRVTNNNHTGGVVPVTFVLSVVDSLTGNQLSPKADTIVVYLDPLPELTVTVAAVDSIACTPSGIAINMLNNTCTNDKILQLVIDNYTKNDSVEGLFTLYDGVGDPVNSWFIANPDGTGVLWGGADTIGNVANASVNLSIVSDNLRDSVVPVYYTVNLVNTSDSLVLVSVKDTIYLKPQPYVKLLETADPTTSPEFSNIVACDTSSFFLHYFVKDACYDTVEKRIRITLDDTYLDYIDLKYRTAYSGGLVDAEQFFVGGTMYSDVSAPITNVSGDFEFSISNTNTFSPDTIRIPYTIDLVLAQNTNRTVGRPYSDTLVVYPYKGLEMNLQNKLVNDTLFCDAVKFDLTAWDYCDPSANKVVKLQITEGNIDDAVQLQYLFDDEYVDANRFFTNGAFYGNDDVINGDPVTARFRLVNNNHTGVAQTLSYTVAIVDTHNSDAVLYPVTLDTVTIVIAPLPNVEVLFNAGLDTNATTLDCGWEEFNINAVLGCREGTNSLVKLKIFNPSDTSYYLMQYYEAYGYNDWFDFSVDSSGTQVGPFYGFSHDTTLNFRIVNNNYSGLDDELVYKVSIIDAATGDEYASNYGIVTLKALTPPSVIVNNLADGQIISCDTTEFSVTTVGGCIDSLVNVFITVDSVNVQYFDLEYWAISSIDPTQSSWQPVPFTSGGVAIFHPSGIPYPLPTDSATLDLRIINKNTSFADQTVPYAISVVGTNPAETYATANGWFVAAVIPQEPTAPYYDLTVAACEGGVAPLTPVSHDPDHLDLIWYQAGSTVTAPTLSTASVGVETYEIALRSKVSPNCEGPKATFTYEVRAVPTITVRDTTICYGNDVDLSTLIDAVAGDSAITYWTTIVPITQLSGSTVNDIRQSVTYTLQAEKFYTGIPAGTCTASADIHITVNPLPETPILAPLTACQYDTAPTPSVPTPVQQDYEFVWYLNAGGTLTPVAAPTMSTLKDTTYNYKVAYRNIITGCESDSLADWSYTVHPKPVTPVLVALDTTFFCVGSSVELRDTITRPVGTTYRWYKDGVLQYSAPTNSFVVYESGSYTSVVISEYGCESDESNTITVIVRPLPTIGVDGLIDGQIVNCDTTDFTVTTVGSCVGTYVNSIITIANVDDVQYFDLYYLETDPAVDPNVPVWKPLVIDPATGAVSFHPNGAYRLPLDSATLQLRIVNHNSSVIERTVQYTVAVVDDVDPTIVYTSTNGWFVIPVIPPVPATPLYDLTVAACAGAEAPALPVSHDPDHLDLKWYVPGSSVALAYPPVLSTSAVGITTYEIALRSNTYPYCEGPRATFTSIVRAVPTVAARDTTVCYGSDVDLSTLVASHSGDDTLTYWTTVVSVAPIVPLVQDIRQSVTYTVQAEKFYNDYPAGVCTASADIRINVNPLPEAPILTPLTACQGTTPPSLPTALQGYEYVWYLSDGSATITEPVLSTADDSTYHYKVGNRYLSTGCESNALADWSYTVYPKPVLPVLDTSGVTTFCAGGNVVISDVVTRPNGTTYRWYKDGATLNTAPTANSFIAYESGEYSLVAISADGCESDESNTVTVTVNLVPTIPVVTPAQSVIICAEEQVTLTAVSTISDNSVISYQWYAGTLSISGATASLYTTPALTTTTTYTVEAISTEGCTSTRSGEVVVTVNPKPVTPAIVSSGTATTVCEGNVPTLSTTTTVGTNTIVWYKNGVEIPFATASSYQPTETGTYTLRFVSRDGCLSDESNAITLTVHPLPPQPLILPGGELKICEGDAVELTAVVSGGFDVASYKWSLNGNPIAGATGLTYSATAGGSYTVRTVSSQNCESTDSEVVVVIVVPRPPAPVIFSSANQDTIIRVRKDESTGIIIDNYSSAYSYQWYHNGYEITGETGNSLQFNPVKIYDAGVYTVVASSLPGCDATSNQVEVIVINTIVVPNVLTPNNDGSNDILVIKGLDEYLSNELTIVNRWGNQVFYMKNYNNSFTGEKLQDGVYFYKLKLTDHNKLTTVKTGYITLKKD
ncbi:MAG: gliding motility-associated C-terminal domain-containing protein [Prevotellaceae bacterium]|nr:gliding motility-associated C-terminal domain-containing protein [Prevotellaceae bacterium]